MRCLRSGGQFQRLTKSVTEDVWRKHGSQGCQFYQQKMLYYNFFFLCCFLIRGNFLSKGHSYSYWESKLDNYLQLLTITDFILALIAWPIWQRLVTVCAPGENIWSTGNQKFFSSYWQQHNNIIWRHTISTFLHNNSSSIPWWHFYMPKTVDYKNENWKKKFFPT